MSLMTLKDWVELILLIVLTIAAIARWIQSRESSDTTLTSKVADLELQHTSDHKQRRQDVEQFNRTVGQVSNDVKVQEVRIDNLEGRVDRIERRQDERD